MASFEGWLAQRRRNSQELACNQLEKCRELLGSEVKIPLNVACSDVLRGVLVRGPGSVCSARGTAWKTVNFHTSDEPNAVIDIPQMSALDSALQLAIFHLQNHHSDEALVVLKNLEQMCEVPRRSIRFPERRIPLGVVGVCGDCFVCEREKIVFNIHAYQDTAPQRYVATETLSSKGTDPVLHEIWQTIDELRCSLKP